MVMALSRTSLVRLVPAAALVLALAACGDDEQVSSGDTTGDTTPIGAPAVEGKAYVAESAARIELPDGSALRLQFDRVELGVSGGCNLMGGAYVFDGNVLKVSEMIQTEMACEEPLMALDTAVAALLQSDPTVALDGEVLTITSGDTSLTLREELPLPVENTPWTVTGLVANDAVTTVPIGSVSTIEFADGMVSVDTGCNTGSGTAVIDEAAGTIEFGPIALTRMACSDELNQLELQIVAALTGTADYTIEGSAMQLRNGDIGLDLTGDAPTG